MLLASASLTLKVPAVTIYKTENKKEVVMKNRSISRTAAVFAVLLAVILVSAALPVSADGVGRISGVEVSEKGAITWDDFPGAVDYWIGVDGGFTPISKGASILDRFNEAGAYHLELDAYTANGEKLLAVWNGEAEYDGEYVKVRSEDLDPVFSTPETTEPIAAKESENPADGKVTAAPAETKPAEETTPPFEADTPLPTERPFEPDLPQPTVTSVLILIGYIVLGLLLLAAMIVIIVLVVALIRRKKK